MDLAVGASGSKGKQADLTVRRLSLCKTVRDVSLILQQSFFSTKFFSSFNCSKLLRGTVVEKIATFSPIMGVQLEGLF